MWSQFNNLVTDNLKADIANASSNNREFKEVPENKYEVSIEKMKATVTTSSQKPMLTVWFNIIAGDYKGYKIFMNQVLTNGVGIHFANEFMRSLDTGIDIKFESFTQYEKLISEVFKAAKKYEYALDYGKNSKGFNTYKIIDKYSF